MLVLLEKFDTNPRNHLIMASKLDAQGGNPTIKKKSLDKLLKLRDNYDLCDVWRVRNTKSKRCTFAQKHSLGFNQRRLDCMFISNTLQELL